VNIGADFNVFRAINPVRRHHVPLFDGGITAPASWSWANVFLCTTGAEAL